MPPALAALAQGPGARHGQRQLVQTWVQRERVRGRQGTAPAPCPTSPLSPPVLTEGAEQLLLHGPGHLLHQAQRGERRKAHVVEEDDVEVPQPVEAAKIPQEVKAGDPCMTGRGSGHASPGGLPQPQPHRSSPSVLEKTGRAELSTSKDTQFPMICGVKKKENLKEPRHSPTVLNLLPGPCSARGRAGGRGSRRDAWCPRVGMPHSAQGHGDSHATPGGALTLVRGVSCLSGSSRVKRGEL